MNRIVGATTIRFPYLLLLRLLHARLHAGLASALAANLAGRALTAAATNALLRGNRLARRLLGGTLLSLTSLRHFRFSFSPGFRQLC